MIRLVGASHATPFTAQMRGDGTTPGRLREVRQFNTARTVSLRSRRQSEFLLPIGVPAGYDICPLAPSLPWHAHGNHAQTDGLDCCFCGYLPMDTQSCPNCKSREVTAALTISQFVYLRCSECATVWAMRDRRDSLTPAGAPYGPANDRRVARKPPVIHDNVRLST